MSQLQTHVSQLARDPSAAAQLAKRLERLPVTLGFPRVWLHSIHNSQYDSVSIVCTGGTLEHQQQVIARLDNPPSKPNYRQVLRAYPEGSNPQINFNSITDALALVDVFASVGKYSGQDTARSIDGYPA